MKTMLPAARREYWLSRPVASVFMTIGMLLAIAIFDHITEPRFNFSIAYFIPILFAAWTLGRGAAITTAVLSDIETINDQLMFIRSGGYPWSVGLIEMTLRLLVFIYVAELAYRMIRAISDARRAADDLRRVNEELQATYERLNEDISTAGLLQSSVLAFEQPETPGCEVGACIRMAGPIGGDFIDAGFVDGRIFACIGDIAGKGIPAALFSTLLKHLLMDAHAVGLRSGNVVEALNLGLSQTLPTERFVTLFYLEMDPTTGLTEYVNAGHPDGLLYCSSAGEIETLPPTGPILTLFESNQEFASRTIQLDTGDSLVMYTDGATESKAPSGEQLGEGPIRRLTIEYAACSAQETAEKICDGIEEAVAGSLGDDLTVLCVKMKAAPDVLPGLKAAT